MRIGNFCNFYPKSKIFLNKVKILKIFFSKKYKFGHFFTPKSENFRKLFYNFFAHKGKNKFDRIFTFENMVKLGSKR